MKKKVKLKLENLKVESFKTDEFDADMQTIKGGWTTFIQITYESINGNPDCVQETIVWAGISRLAKTPVCVGAKGLLGWGEFLGNSFNSDCHLCIDNEETNINCNSHNPCFVGSNSQCLTFDVCGC